MNVVCKTARRQMSAEMDGELGWAKRALLKLHLAVCPYCTAVHRSLHETVGLLHDLDEAPPSDEKKPGSA